MAGSRLRTTAIGVGSALALAAAGQAGAVQFQAGDTTVSLGGYLKGDFIYNVNEDLGDTLNTRAVNVGDAEDNEIEGHTRVHARQSRLSLQTTTENLGGSDLTTRFEGDFFGGGGNEVFSNSNSFRIRHAYGSWNGILAGQTWSNFMYLIALPPTLDFAGPAGQSFIRQGQMRYTVGGFSVSLENPESLIVGSVSDGSTGVADLNPVSSKDPLPDLTLAYRGSAGSFSYSVAGLARQLEVDDGSDSESTAGFGVMGAARWTMGGTTLAGGVVYGDGIGRYVYEGVERAAFIDSDGDLEAIEQLGTVLWAQQELTPTTSVMLAWGHTDSDVDDLVDTYGNDSVQETSDTIHANIQYSPVSRITYGLSYQYAMRETQGGADGDASRLQFSGQYSF